MMLVEREENEGDAQGNQLLNRKSVINIFSYTFQSVLVSFIVLIYDVLIHPFQ